MIKPEFIELEVEIENNKKYLIGCYLDMLDPNKNIGKDELELLDDFINFFMKNINKEENYKEYMIFLRSYILLSHAAIEEFIEDTIKYYLNESEKIYLQDQKINSLLKWFLLKSEFSKEFQSKSFEYALGKLKSQYFEIINKNHGIKKSNLEKMLFKIGIENISFEPFEKIGEMRGNFAHYGGKGAHMSLKISVPLNPMDCVKMVEDVLGIIKEELIEYFENIMRE